MKSGTPPVTKQLFCNQQYTVPCNVPITMNALYLCNSNTCNTTPTYKLTTPAGVTTTGTTAFTFNPTQSGIYTLKLYGYCGNKICDSCTIRFVVNCPPACNCNGGRWGDIWAKSGTPPITKELRCNKQYNLSCNVPVTIDGNYFCNGADCTGNLKYGLIAPSGTTTTGTVPFTFIPSQNGIYRLNLYGFCGTELCDNCTITFRVDCGFITMVRPKGRPKK